MGKKAPATKSKSVKQSKSITQTKPKDKVASSPKLKKGLNEKESDGKHRKG